MAVHTHEPRWPAFIALLAVAGLTYALPESLVLGPTWLPLVLALFLGALGYIARHVGRDQESQELGYISVSMVTVYMLASLLLLVSSLPQHTENASTLLRSGALLWISNVIVFATWYWRLDAGGPHVRENRETHTHGAFLFPQMTDEVRQMNERLGIRWSPTFIDYLYLSFGTSAAFSATDTLPLSRWAKVLMMLQATISIAVVVLLVGRSVNIF